MKKCHPIFAAILLLAFNTMSFAADEKPATPPPPAHEGHGQPPHGMGMMDEEHLKAMQEHILAMHDLSNQILAEKDPAKKEQLKQQQRDLIKAHHASMMQHKMKH